MALNIWAAANLACFIWLRHQNSLLAEFGCPVAVIHAAMASFKFRNFIMMQICRRPFRAAGERLLRSLRARVFRPCCTEEHGERWKGCGVSRDVHDSRRN